MMDMYAETILDHYRRPHNHGALKDRNAEHKEYNPLCGDVIEIHLLIQNNKVKDARFTGRGCAISQAATSLLTDEIKGKSIDEIKRLNKKFVLDLLGVEISPARMKCALLGIKALKLTIYYYLTKQSRKSNEKDFEVEDA